MTKLYILNGPDKGRSFELTDGAIYVGRATDNDIRIKDKAVSRRHLRIVKRRAKYHLMDLKSLSGTLYNGKFLATGVEHDAKEGMPIAIGMSVICIGEQPAEEIVSFLDPIEFTRESANRSGIFEVHREKTNQKKLELLYRVSSTLSKGLPFAKALKEILDHIFDLLGRIDRGAFFLVDPDTETITNVISKPYKVIDEGKALHSRDVVSRVIKDREPVVISNVQTLQEDDLAATLKVLKIQSVICLPLMNGPYIMGAMYFDSQRMLYGFSREDVLLFTDVSQRIAIAAENACLDFQPTTTI